MYYGEPRVYSADIAHSTRRAVARWSVMTTYAKYFYSFDPSSAPVISFARRGDRDNLLRARKPGDLIVFVATRTAQTASRQRGMLLGAAEIGDTPVDTKDLADLSGRPQSHFRNGEYKWPHGIPMLRAWKFDPPEPRRFLRDHLRPDARIRAVPLSASDADRLREELNWVEVRLPSVWQEDRNDSPQTNWDWLPATQQLVAHWKAKDPTTSQRKMLVTHYWSPDPDMDPGYLSAAMGWNNAGSAHLHYGTFARSTAEAIGCSYPHNAPYDYVSLFAAIVGLRGQLRWRMHRQVREAIAQLGWHREGGATLTDRDVEVSLFHEGEVMRRVITYRARSASVRQICLDHHGARCKSCDFEPARELGPDFAGLIDVHHLDPIAASTPGRATDPLNDCVPLCPTCHRLAHYRLPSNRCRDVHELRALVRRTR